MPDYSQGKIYSIRSHQTEAIYIGSTTQTLPKRLAKHRTSFKFYKKGRRNYVSSFEILEYPDYYIELLELYPCSCKAELLQREGHYIRTYDNCVNKFVPGRTQKQWYQDNKEAHIIKVKQYHQDNKEKIKQYRQDNKEKIKQQRKQYRQDNKETLLAYGKQYRQDNKEKINLKAAKKITCSCGSIIARSGKSKHLKTNKHKNWEKNNN